RAKQLGAAADTAIGARRLRVPVATGERSLGPGVAGHLVLRGAQLRSPLGVVFHDPVRDGLGLRRGLALLAHAWKLGLFLPSQKRSPPPPGAPCSPPLEIIAGRTRRLATHPRGECELRGPVTDRKRTFSLPIVWSSPLGISGSNDGRGQNATDRPQTPMDRRSHFTTCCIAPADLPAKKSL